MDVRTKLLTLALTAAGIAAVTVAQAQPAPAPSAPPPVPAPTATTDPNAQPAPPPADPNAPPAAPTPTTTSTAQPAPPPPGAPAPQDPNAPPAPPPVAQPQPPPVMAPVPPPAQPAPPPAPPAAPEKPKGMTLLQRFAGSQISWNHSVSLTTLGIDTREGGIATNTSVGAAASAAGRTLEPGSGGSTVGISNSNDVYTQSFIFTPAFFIYKGDRHLVRAFTQVLVNTELTNSDTTTQLRQPDVFDVPLRIVDTIPLASWGGGAGGSAAAGALARDPTLAGAAEYRTWGSVTGGFNFPTSRASRGSGIYLTSHLAVGLRQQIKLFGSSSDYLSNITFTLSEAWQHQFSRASTRVNDGIDVPRQDGAGNPLTSDQLGGGALPENRLIHNISFFMPLIGNLQISGGFQVWNEFPHQFKGSDCEVQLMTGCANLPESESKMRSVTSLDVSLFYLILPELGVDIGYSNFTGQLTDASRYRNPIFSPSSSFYADITIFPDQIIKRLAAPPKPKNQTGSR